MSLSTWFTRSLAAERRRDFATSSAVTIVTVLPSGGHAMLLKPVIE
jgi:hypothetical protein